MRAVLSAFLILFLASACGGAFPLEQDQAGTETAPTLESIGFYDNGQEVSLTVPTHQVADYEIKYCSKSNSNTCYATFRVVCSGSSSCALSVAAPNDTIAVSVSGASKTIRHLRPYRVNDGGSYAIRARALNSRGSSGWTEAQGCTFSIPAQCWGE